jgi:hypothetical protein
MAGIPHRDAHALRLDIHGVAGRSAWDKGVRPREYEPLPRMPVIPLTAINGFPARQEEETTTMMPEKATESPLESLFAGLREAFEREYQRGQDDTLARVIAAARGPAAPTKRNGAPTTRNLINAELTRAGNLTARETFESDANLGRAVSRDGIEQCLKRAKKTGRYSVEAGRWSLQT